MILAPITCNDTQQTNKKKKKKKRIKNKIK